MISGGKQIVAIGTAPAFGISDDLGLFRQGQVAAVLVVTRIDHIGEGVDLTAICQGERQSGF